MAADPVNVSDGARRVGYVISRHPAFSHAFIATEIAAVRRSGWTVGTFSLNRPDVRDPPGAPRTFVIKSQTPLSWMRTAGRAALRDPRAVASIWRSALGSGRRRGRGVRNTVWATAYVVEALSVFEVARQQRLSHLHAHFANSGADVAWLAAEFGRRSGTSVGPRSFSMTVHGPSDFDDADSIDLAGKVAAAHGVICISDYARKQLAALVPSAAVERVQVIRIGVRFDDIVQHPGRDQDSDFHVLFVGRMVQEKAPLLLLEALAGLRNAGLDPSIRVTATFAGAGPLLDEVRERADALTSVDVRCLGALEHEDVLGLYARSDVFCLPSYSEGLPVVIMEAMSAGIAVVSTPVAAIPELIERDVSGLLVTPGDVDGLTSALLRLAEDRQFRRELAETGRLAVRRLHDVDASAAAICEVFDRQGAARR